MERQLSIPRVPFAGCGRREAGKAVDASTPIPREGDFAFPRIIRSSHFKGWQLDLIANSPGRFTVMATKPDGTIQFIPHPTFEDELFHHIESAASYSKSFVNRSIAGKPPFRYKILEKRPADTLT